MKRLLFFIISLTLSTSVFAQVNKDNLVRITTSYTTVEEAVDAIVPVLGEIGIVPSYVDAAHGIINLAPTYGCDMAFLTIYAHAYLSEGVVKLNFSGLLQEIGPGVGQMPIEYDSVQIRRNYACFMRMANIALAIPNIKVEYLNYKSLTSLAKRVNEQSTGL